MTGCWIAGTDTNVGKTFVTAALVHFLRSYGIDAVPMKPIQTGSRSHGLDDLEQVLQVAQLSPPDHERSTMCPYRLEMPASPHLAALVEGCVLDTTHILECLSALSRTHDAVLVEGSGGVLTPIHPHMTMLDLIQASGLPVLLVARGSLGTINHTLLTLRALRAAGVPLAGVIINDPSPCAQDLVRVDNPKTIASMGAVPIIADIPFQPTIPPKPLEGLWTRKLFGNEIFSIFGIPIPTSAR